MTEKEFTFWLDGFLNGNNLKSLPEKEVVKIKNKLDSIFNKVTPNYSTTRNMSCGTGTSGTSGTSGFHGTC